MFMDYIALSHIC